MRSVTSQEPTLHVPAPAASEPLSAAARESGAGPAPWTPPWRRDNLRGQCVLDTSARVASGIPLYVVLWLIICAATGLTQARPGLVYGNAAGLAAIALFRFVFTAQLRQLVDTRVALADRLLTLSIFVNGLYWGVLSGVSIIDPTCVKIWWAMLLVSAGMCAAGTVVMGINKAVRVWYPVSILVPIVLCALSDPNERNLLLAAMMVVFTVYVIIASNVVHVDYWEALHGRVAAEGRAREMERLSETDALTQVPNRLGFERQFAIEWRRAQRQGAPLSVLMIDLDHFKRINDTHGHPFGDLCLKAAADALREATRRSGDLLARYGGEEFLLLLPDTDLAGAMVLAERVLESVRAIRMARAGQNVPLTCSVGAGSMAPRPGDTPAQLVKQADDALYRAKQQGRDRVCG